MTKSQAIALVEQMDSILPINEALQKLKELIDSGDFQALKLWFAYRIGQPQQYIDHTTKGQTIRPELSVLTKDAVKEINKLYEGSDSINA
jgi:hypothetical protein